MFLWSFRWRAAEPDTPPSGSEARRGPVTDRVPLERAEVATFRTLEHAYWSCYGVRRRWRRWTLLARAWLRVHASRLLALLVALAAVAATLLGPLFAIPVIALLAVWLCRAVGPARRR